MTLSTILLAVVVGQAAVAAASSFLREWYTPPDLPSYVPSRRGALVGLLYFLVAPHMLVAGAVVRWGVRRYQRRGHVFRSLMEMNRRMEHYKKTGKRLS